MGNNKKNKSKLKDVAAKKEEEEEVTKKEEEEAPPNKPVADGGLSMAQLGGLSFLLVAIFYLMEYRRAIRAGPVACAKYVVGVEECSPLDMLMIDTKYYSGFWSLVLSAWVMRTCWKDEPLLLRFKTILCSSPLITTLMALQATREHCNPSEFLKIGVVCTVLLSVAAASIHWAPWVADRRWLGTSINLQESTLLTLLLVFAWEIYALLANGVTGYLLVPDDAPTTTSVILIPFIAVDKATMVGILAFALFFLSEVRQRSVLLLLSVLQFASRYYIFPYMKSSLKQPEFEEKLLFGSAMFALTAAFGPSMSLGGTTTTAAAEASQATDEKAKKE